jgi:hypothetical protein
MVGSDHYLLAKRRPLNVRLKFALLAFDVFIKKPKHIASPTEALLGEGSSVGRLKFAPWLGPSTPIQTGMPVF